jgi:diaminopimelate epimerase
MTDAPHNAAVPFLKMHGLGNDFVVIDARSGGDPVTPALVRAVGDRHRGVGFDQLAVIRNGNGVAAEVDFWNADGSLSAACGNATRCVARLLMDEKGTDNLVLRTARGDLRAEEAEGGMIRVNMGQPQLDWREIPLARDVDINALPLDGSPGAAGMGNPHCVFVVDDVEAVDITTLGPRFEHDPLFPQRTNVEFCQVLDRNNVRVRVWERGTGVTLACGSGACAVAVVLHRQGHTDRQVSIHLDGGTLGIDWRDDGVWMTGPTALSFRGELSPEILAAR